MRNLNALRMFDAAARHLTFRQAAEELNLTQGAVAQQVRGLEANLATKLFHRHARGLKLTQAGKEYHTPIHQALALIDAATDRLSPSPERITISVPPSFATKWLVPRLTAFATALPDVELHITASESVSDFRLDGIDLAIRQGALPRGEDLRATLLAPLDLVTLCSPHYAETHALADLFALDLIQDGHRHWDRLLQARSGVGQVRHLQFNQTALAVDAAANGQGVTIAPRLLVAADLDTGKLVELGQIDSPEHSGFFLVVPETTKPPRRRGAVVEWIKAQARL